MHVFGIISLFLAAVLPLSFWSVAFFGGLISAATIAVLPVLIYWFLLDAALGTAIIGAAVVYQPPAIEIGSERQLFVDDLLLDRLENVSRIVNQPHKIPQNPILVATEPWESNPARIHYLDVVFDEAEKTFKLWYNTFNEKTSQWQL